MRIALTVGMLAATLALVGCGATAVKPVPDVAGLRLNAAQDMLDSSGLRYETVGGGALGIVVRSHWLVCRQAPAPGKKARSVTLFVARSCLAPAHGVVPDVIDDKLDEAQQKLEAAGFRVVAKSYNGDPIFTPSLWTVCDQTPAPGHDGSTVVLDVAHDCWDYS